MPLANAAGFKPAINPVPIRQRYDAYPENIDYTRMAAEIPGTQRPGQTGHYRSTLLPSWDCFIDPSKPQTLYEIASQTCQEIPEDDALGYIPITSRPGETPVRYIEDYHWLKYAEVDQTRIEVGAALMHLYRTGILGEPERIDPTTGREGGWGVGIWSGNRPEWQILDMACHVHSLISVALYDTLGPTATEYVANHAALPIIFTSMTHLPALLKLLPNAKTVKAIVCMDPLIGTEAEIASSWSQERGVWLGDWAGFRKIGREHPTEPNPPRPDNVATLSYTSGTTGNPKGVVLTHRAMAAAVICNTYWSVDLPDRGMTMASYLPLSHVYARFLDLVAIYNRGNIAYTTGDPLRLLADIQLQKPHIFGSVPRVLNRIYAAINAQASAGGLKGNLLRRALDTKLANFRATGSYTHPVYDRLVFSKLQALLGGRVKLLSTGSAPISGTVYETLKVAFCVTTVEGWGMTETVGTGSKNFRSDKKGTGTIGSPVPCNEFKLVDVAEMGYLSTDKPNPRGELCVRGVNLFSCYYKDPKTTAEALDSEGWLHTGDVCTVDSAGRFKIVDRKKNIMKLAQGEYVALETVEGVYSICPLFLSFYLHGDSLRNHLVGVGVLDPVQVIPWIKTLHGRIPAVANEAELQTLIAGGGAGAKALRKEIVKLLRKMAKEKKLKGYEQVKGIHLTLEPFPTDLMTPTFKFKRAAVAKYFVSQLDQAYTESEEPEENQSRAKL